MKNLSLYLFAISVMLVLSVSCGKKKSGGGSPAAFVDNAPSTPDTSVPQNDEAAQVLEGSYEAILRPLNTAISGWLPSGRAKFKILQNQFTVNSFIEDDTRVLHIQSVHTGRRCPTLADDANADGFVDVVEMQKATGSVLIPLDGDLNTQLDGQEFYPLGQKYNYTRTAMVDLMFRDLYTPNLLAESGFAKLANGAPMNLEGKVVMVHGSSDVSRVPMTVQTTGTQPRNVMIPVLCGVIKRKI